ncbi:hypothetical protein B0H10DRAFT_1954459 [Mycena sp. CBHHK59/15]|nr:hypothetical protein B0H10DRAFT_1954459 [Mycena sp. CBHHK59/15]
MTALEEEEEDILYWRGPTIGTTSLLRRLRTHALLKGGGKTKHNLIFPTCCGHNRFRAFPRYCHPLVMIPLVQNDVKALATVLATIGVFADKKAPGVWIVRDRALWFSDRTRGTRTIGGFLRRPFTGMRKRKTQSDGQLIWPEHGNHRENKTLCRARLGLIKPGPGSARLAGLGRALHITIGYQSHNPLKAEIQS